MAYDPSGVYTLPPAYRAQPGTTIRAEQHNLPLEDIANSLSFALVRDGRAGMTGDLSMNGNAVTGMAARSDPLSAATVGQLMPIGSVTDFAGSSAPSGWLFCGGQEVSRTNYADLFAVIGTTYGNGNGSTTFNVPDLRGLVVAGRGNMAGSSGGRLTNGVFGENVNSLGSIGGSQDHTLTTAQMPSHSHGNGSLSVASHSHGNGSLRAADHSHSNGSLSASSHSHGNGSLVAASHNHGNGSLSVASHSHGNGSLQAASAGGFTPTLRMGRNVGTVTNRPPASDGGVDQNISGPIQSIPPHTHNITGSTSAAAPNVTGSTSNASANVTGSTSSASANVTGSTSNASANVTGNTGSASPTVNGSTSNAGSGNAHPNVQPTMILNKIILASHV